MPEFPDRPASRVIDGAGEASNARNAPLYAIEPCEDDAESWRVIGPNGVVGVYQTASDAQAKADYLNEQVAEESEDDF